MSTVFGAHVIHCQKTPSVMLITYRCKRTLSHARYLCSRESGWLPKLALVTGASRGLGAHIAQNLSNKGVTVAGR